MTAAASAPAPDGPAVTATNRAYHPKTEQSVYYRTQLLSRGRSDITEILEASRC